MTAATPARKCSAELDAYVQLLVGGRTSGRLIEIRYATGRGGMGRMFIPARRTGAAVRMIATLAARTDVYCGVLLRARHAGGRDALADPQLVWVEIDRPDALDRLKQFEHSPSMTVLSGSPGHAHAYWQLDAPVDVAELEHANRRLAHRLGGDLASVDGARILRPCGTLSHKHQPPSPVSLAAHHPARRYPLTELVHGLEDPPARSRAALGGAAGRGRVSDLDELLLAIPASTYVRQLAGLEPRRDGKVNCPFHDDADPSLQLYDDGTFYCFGCGAGGSIYDFAARLWSTGTKGREFLALRQRLHAACCL
jgi:RepB DNA-primase from phage plasmid/CHC2 zinc finger